MKLAPSLLKKRPVCDVVSEHMLEDVLGLGKEACFIE
jgi:hypothetical protein